ncbi:MAG: hypothetical protein HFI63_00830 [Lachnospiraceae bacterium]|nr:hypothetical protein [Lachnospiraceae bacterium]
MTEQFRKYLEHYISLLVGRQSEFFIAIVDVERESALEFLKGDRAPVSYKTAWFERRDYAEAVRLRNDPTVRQIVLLSNDTAKMIDSLKDFVEYPILPERQEDLWRCLEAAFEVELDNDCRKIVGTVLEQKQISLEDLLTYINCCIKRGRCSGAEMMRNLYQFELWSMRYAEAKVPLPSEGLEKFPPSKAQIKRMIRNSDPFQIEKRLIGGLTGEKVVFDGKEQKDILDCLSKNNLRELFRKIPYDERMEQLFRASSRTFRTVTKEKPEMKQYDTSYQYILSESIEGEVWQIEEELLAELGDLPEENGSPEEADSPGRTDSSGKNDSPEGNSPLETSWKSFKYQEMESLQKELKERWEEIPNLNFPRRKQSLVEAAFSRLESEFFEAVEAGKKYTPACLEHYVESQKKLVYAYFGFLALCLSDDGIARRCEGAGFLERIQRLFCKEEGGVVKMPFYHPLMGFYYWKLQERLAEYRRLQDFHQDDFSQEMILAMTEIAQMDFPISYILWDRRLYQLDVNSLQNWGEEVAFERTADYAVGSWTNIRLLNEDLEDYITRKRFLPEIRVTIVDLNDIREIRFMMRRLQKLAKSENCMVHKVILNIISEKEEALKKELQESMEMELDNPQILIRFTRELYQRGREYDLRKMMEESDLLFLADSSLLYQKPRLTAWEKEGNWFRIVMEQTGTERIAEQFLNREEELEALWDSVHHIELEEETKLARWKTKELRLPVFNEIRKAVAENPRLTVVLMSSNPQILQHIYHVPGFRARKSIAPGQKMLLLNFHEGSRRKELRRGTEARVQMMLKPFLEEFLEDSDLFSEENQKEWEREKPCLIFDYREHKPRILFEVTAYSPDQDYEERVAYYGTLIENMLDFACDSPWFKEKLITMLYEEASSYGATLLVDYMERTGLEQMREKGWKLEYAGGKTDRGSRDSRDMLNVLALQNMLDFIRGRAVVDEYMRSRFSEFYSRDMLEGCLEAEEAMEILEKDTKQKIQKLYRMMENANE